jgi:hypothetical protein
MPCLTAALMPLVFQQYNFMEYPFLLYGCHNVVLTRIHLIHGPDCRLPTKAISLADCADFAGEKDLFFYIVCI